MKQNDKIGMGLFLLYLCAFGLLICGIVSLLVLSWLSSPWLGAGASAIAGLALLTVLVDL